MSKHTLGPWEASEGYPSDIWHVDMPSRGYSVVVSRAEEDWDMAVQEVQANAHLIAAAPELLDALITTLDLAVGHACDSRGIRPAECEDWEWVKQARKLIAKVNGGE